MTTDTPRHVDRPDGQTGQSEHDNAALLVDLDRLSPTEVVTLDRFLRAKQREHDEAVEAGRADDRYEREYAPRIEAVNTALQQLPVSNPGHARAVYAAFVESPLEDDRISGASMIDFLVEADHEYGLVLWDQLVRDPSPRVRLEAYNRLGERGLFSDTPEQSESSRERLGIDWYDVARLLDAYIRAEHGTAVYELGDIALRRATVPPAGSPGQ